MDAIKRKVQVTFQPHLLTKANNQNEWCVMAIMMMMMMSTEQSRHSRKSRKKNPCD